MIWLPAEVSCAFEVIVESLDATFSNLVKISKLDPRNDFRFSNLNGVDFSDSDLRGFDFSGSDLIGAIKNKRTIIDETTLFSGSKVAWIEAETPDIVKQMLAIQSSTSSQTRQGLLADLLENYRSVAHIRQFLITSIRKTHSVDAFFDFAEALRGEADVSTKSTILEEFRRLVTERGNLITKARKKVGHSPVGFELIVNRLEGTNNPTIKEIALLFFEGERKGDRSTLVRSIDAVQEMIRYNVT